MPATAEPSGVLRHLVNMMGRHSNTKTGELQEVGGLMKRTERESLWAEFDFIKVTEILAALLSSHKCS